ncbi:TolA-binding protein [Halorubrum trapanicum]|uniref:TolA-binding protein n=1 Tax=Halorubrum trapanicum TaxID=29284 RepID=A0A8J7UQN2_9EURY|nr:bZIP transcription factor [Halorubrum trapanicum]MBP1902693.1 TolA-binding protein [Halorubrum trapanicum]
MSNRVEDLERQVAELQAAVNGLTEELVEMKERVRQLEDERSVAVEADATGAETGSEDDTAASVGDESAAAGSEAERVSGGERTTHSDDHVDVFESVEDSSDGASEGDATAAADAGDGEDVIVPEQSATTPDADATDETDDDGESSEGDDIIVA